MTLQLLRLATQRIAAANPKVRAEAYDIAHFPELKDKFNVGFNIITSSEGGSDRFATQMISGNLGDLIFLAENNGQQHLSEAIEAGLDEGQTTVGTELNIRHVSATPVGLEVRAEAEVTAVEGKAITFKVTAYDEAGVIGEGEHKRFIVSSQKFLDKAYAKL